MAKKEMVNTKPAYCPHCKYYLIDCTPDHEDWRKGCDAFEEWEKEEWRESL